MPRFLTPGVPGTTGQCGEGGAAKLFVTRMYVHDAVLLAPSRSPVGDWCVQVSQNMRSDQDHLLGERQVGHPPLLTPDK